MDLTKVPELQGTRLAETKKDLAARGIVVTDLGASAEMHEKDPARATSSSTRAAASSTSPRRSACRTCGCSANKLPPGGAQGER